MGAGLSTQDFQLSGLFSPPQYPLPHSTPHLKKNNNNNLNEWSYLLIKKYICK